MLLVDRECAYVKIDHDPFLIFCVDYCLLGTALVPRRTSVEPSLLLNSNRPSKAYGNSRQILVGSWSGILVPDFNERGGESLNFCFGLAC